MQVEGLESDIAYVTLTQATDFADFFWNGGGGGGVREAFLFCKFWGPQKNLGKMMQFDERAHVSYFGLLQPPPSSWMARKIQKLANFNWDHIGR